MNTINQPIPVGSHILYDFGDGEIYYGIIVSHDLRDNIYEVKTIIKDHEYIDPINPKHFIAYTA